MYRTVYPFVLQGRGCEALFPEVLDLPLAEALYRPRGQQKDRGEWKAPIIALVQFLVKAHRDDLQKADLIPLAALASPAGASSASLAVDSPETPVDDPEKDGLTALAALADDVCSKLTVGGWGRPP